MQIPGDWGSSLMVEGLTWTVMLIPYACLEEAGVVKFTGGSNLISKCPDVGGL